MNEMGHDSNNEFNDERELKHSKRERIERSYGDDFLTYLLGK